MVHGHADSVKFQGAVRKPARIEQNKVTISAHRSKTSMLTRLEKELN